MTGFVADRPYRLGPNKVPVYYEGGAGIDRFRGERGSEGPEDWVGSVTRFPEMLLPAGADPLTGISRFPGGMPLDSVIRADPSGWLGPALHERYGAEPGLLVKLLDAGERLPVHCHPGRTFASRHLGSRFGKNEGWIVVAVETGARIWLGFSREVEASELRSWVDSQDTAAMLGAMNEFAATGGDVFYVPAGVPHAIGPGVTIVELQEPTSFSILAEHESFGVDGHSATLGLGWELALSCFDLRAYSDAVSAPLRPPGQVVVDASGGTLTRLFDEEAEPFFQAYRARATGGEVGLGESGFGVLVAEEGSGQVRFAAGEEPIRAGETWIVPYGAGPLTLEGDAELLVCRPPSGG
jgi:mannose-6-phosphate isomerase